MKVVLKTPMRMDEDDDDESDNDEDKVLSDGDKTED